MDYSQLGHGLYNSRSWQVVRQHHLSRHPYCVFCEIYGRKTGATEVDHILPVRKGGDPYDPDNLQSLCKSCHSRKTASEDGAFGNPSKVKGCDADGRPLDPQHPWFRREGDEL